MTISTWPPLIRYEVAFNTSANSGVVPPYWQDLSSRVQSAWRTQRGRQYELDTNTTGKWTVQLANADGALDPSNTASPFAPNLLPYRPCRIRVQTGVNALTVDQATCGQGSPITPGPVPAKMGVTNDSGYALSLVASGSAYTGTQVYQVTLPSTAAASSTILLVPLATVTPGAAYSFTALARIPTGTSAGTNVALLWYGENGVSLGTVGGTSSTITSGSSGWTTLTVSGRAPTGTSPALYAALKVETTSSLSSPTTWQIGALQFEASATPTNFQVPQVLSPNLLPRAIATGTASIDPVNESAAAWFFPTAGSVAQANFLTAAPSGHTSAVAWTTAAGTTNGSPLYAGVAAAAASTTGPVADCVQVAGGSQYTFSVYLMRAASADSTVQVTASFRWSDADGNLVSTSSGTAVTVTTSGWVRATCTATAPAGAAWGRPRIFISAPASTTAVNTVYGAGWQVEQNSSASSWFDPGPTYQIFNGSIERWPQSWALSGTYGQTGAVGVDAFALFAQGTLGEPFINEVLALNPNFVYLLSDPAGASSCADASGNRPPAPVDVGPFGSGSLVFGSSMTSASSAGQFEGSSGTVATFTNTVSGAGVQKPETFVNIAKTSVQPGPPTSGSWTRMISFRSTNVPAVGTEMNLWTAYPPSWLSGNLSSWWMQIVPGGFANMNIANSANFGLSYTGTTNVCDGNWHQMVTVVDAAGTGGHFINFYVDGVLVATNTSGARYPSGIVADALGCSITTGSNSFCQGFVGDMAHAIEVPAALTQSQITNLYNSWRTASTGDSTDQRTQRVLDWIGYQGATDIQPGSTALMGPATDIAGSTAIDASTALLPGGIAFTGGSAIQGLNTIAQTEQGNVYVSNTGAVTFKARSDRYNQTTPMIVFGEATASGEWPYETVGFDFDTAHLYTNVQATQYASSQVATASSADAQDEYGQRVFQLTMNQQEFSETQDASDYLLARYSQAALRVANLTLHPSAVPGLWTVCLQLEIGTRIRVVRRPPYPAPPITFDGFIESVAWSVDPKGSALVNLQCSPADVTAYWTLGALTTTLNAQANAGANTIKINGLPDSAINALASSLSPGTQLTIDPGTAIAETVTIAPGGIPTTNPGYSAPTLTLTGTLAHTHAVGATVCEALPVGYSDPATWNTASILGALATTVAAPASSGSSTITVNALPDAKANGAGSDWNTGDLLWLSPGTSAFEGYNLVHPNVATAGEGALPLAPGSSGSAYGMSSDLGTPVVTLSATAFQGSGVWQLAVAGGASTPAGLIYLLKVPATALKPFTASAYVRSITSGANPQVDIYVKFLSATGASLGQSNSSMVTLIGSPTAFWTRLAASATAPAGTAWVQLGILLTGSSPASAWTFQADALQVEAASSASTFGVCPQVLSVGASVPGYSAVTLTLNAPLVSNHAVGDVVCDPLPPGTTSPLAVPATTRVAY
jgi:hypothetical protein